jgi:hypothetical protein
MTAPFKKISTWRERIGQNADFPLHVPTDVERAMVAEIAELRAAQSAGEATPTLGELFASVGGWMNGGDLGYPSFGSMDALRVFTQRSIRAALTAAPLLQEQTKAARDVLAERRRQVDVEGWAPEHDDKYRHCELARAAASYAVCSHPDQLSLAGARLWPFHIEWFKRTTYRRDLIKAGALLLAEIERVDRTAQSADKSTGGDHG